MTYIPISNFEIYLMLKNEMFDFFMVATNTQSSLSHPIKIISKYIKIYEKMMKKLRSNRESQLIL